MTKTLQEMVSNQLENKIATDKVSDVIKKAMSQITEPAPSIADYFNDEDEHDDLDADLGLSPKKEVKVEAPKKPKKVVNPITLSDEQDKVVNDIHKWFNKKKGYGKYELAGYAGTGKTTVVDFVLTKLGLHKEQIKMCAPTGTASLVLREKTEGFATSTLHKLFYEPVKTSSGGVYFTPSTFKLGGVKLVIIDEGSMIGGKIAEEIISVAKKSKAKLLIVGDPGQLPPVKDVRYFLNNPDAMLTQIMRQAEGNPIIDLSMQIRKATDDAHQFNFGNQNRTISKSLFIRQRRDISIPYLAKVVQNKGAVIVGGNRTRSSLNSQMRSDLGFNQRDVLMNNEKICIKKNYPESEEGIEVTNGMVGTVSKVKKIDEVLYEFVFTPDAFEGSRKMMIRMDILFEHKGVNMYKLNQENKGRKSRGEKGLVLGSQAVLGYAITCHASQGSQWDTVVVVNESYMFGRDKGGQYHDESYEDQNKWLYTAITRAAKNLVVFN